VAGGKERLYKPSAGQGPVARPSLIRSGGLRKTCVQETGCGTRSISSRMELLQILQAWGIVDFSF